MVLYGQRNATTGAIICPRANLSGPAIRREMMVVGCFCDVSVDILRDRVHPA